MKLIINRSAARNLDCGWERGNLLNWFFFLPIALSNGIRLYEWEEIIIGGHDWVTFGKTNSIFLWIIKGRVCVYL